MDDLTNPEHVERLAKVADIFAKAMKVWQHKTQKHNEDVRDTLRALSAALEQARAVKVRPLEWEGCDDESYSNCGRYHIYDLYHRKPLVRLVFANFYSRYISDHGGVNPMASAKAAAQAHHEARVRAMLDMGDG